MRSLITGSSGHLGEALARTLGNAGETVVGLDLKASPFTSVVGSITDTALVRELMVGVDCVFHTATLHKPHVATHSKQDFIDTNITGTLTLLEAAIDAGVDRFVFTSTTSLFGDALRPPAGSPAAWITEEVVPIPKNIYGATKSAAEDLCLLIHKQKHLNCIVLRTSRFFPEEDDDREKRARYADANIKANEFLFRRVDVEDVVSAHLCARSRAPDLGFGRYIVSATSPFLPEDLTDLNFNAREVVALRIPEYESLYEQLGWTMFEQIDRVYVNEAARRDLDWRPGYDFRGVLDALRLGNDIFSPLARQIGRKGYHEEDFANGPFPVED